MWTCLAVIAVAQSLGAAASVAHAALEIVNTAQPGNEETNPAESSASPAPSLAPQTPSLDESTNPVDTPRFEILGVENRPGWVEQPARCTGEGDHVIAVSSKPWKTEFEAQEALEANIRAAVAEYLTEQFGHRAAAQHVGALDADLDRLVREQYSEELQWRDEAIGRMHQTHALVVFSPELRTQLHEQWKQHVVSTRLVRTGAGVVALLLVLFVALGF
ncbi:MAG: hypothetical protein KDA41_05175, partial [Planctomycetales bacterium]|nr:hypothetical protein [Planctomycetales bacterium]